MNIVLHLRIVGVLLILLAIVNLFVPGRFNWRQDLAKVTLLNRQIFVVHTFFIILILVMFGALSLLYAGHLLEPSPLARAILAGLGFFWLSRLLTQWFYYDPRIWRGHRFNTMMHYVFTGLWIYFTATFTTAFWCNLKGIM